MQTLWQDLRYGARMLLKSPGFTLVAVLSLALGIGANTAIFSLLDVVLLKSLPVQEPEKLVLFGKAESVGLTNGFPNRSWDLFSYPFYQEVKQNAEVFSGVAAIQSVQNDVHGVVTVGGASGIAERLNVQLVSGTYFSVLGVNASLGRALTEADDVNAGAHPVAVVSYSWWESRLGGDPAAVGNTITIDKQSYTIIGVAPREFFGTTVGQAPDVWIPIAMSPQIPPNWNGRTERLFQSLFLIGRLKDGVSEQQASSVVNLLFKRFLEVEAGTPPAAERVQDIQRASIELTPAGRGLSELRQQFSLSLRILMVVVGVVLLIACANIANLLLSRAAARQKEFAVRLALGAGHMRIIRQSLTESVLLAGLGGMAGILLAWWGSQLLVLMVSDGSTPLPLDVTPNIRILGFTLGASLLSALIFGMAPALRTAGINPGSLLSGGKGVVQTSAQSGFGKLLVVAQVALSLLLLVGAGLFVRTLVNLQSIPSGFKPENVMLFQIDTATAGYKDAQLATLMRQVEERVKTVRGVQGASFAFFTFNQGAWTGRAFTRDQNPPEGQSRLVMNNVVGDDYFKAMGLPLVAGRGFGPQDTDKSQKVAVISEAMAQRFFPNRSPLGERFGLGSPESRDRIEVIGVVKDAKYLSLDEQTRPMAYYPHAQGSGFLNNFVVRISGSPEPVIRQVRQAIQDVNQNLPIDEVLTLSDQIGRSLVQQKLVARLAGFFGLLALLLSCVGLYGVLSYAVARRTNEIGIRLALGAQRKGVLWMVMRESLALTSGGIVIGMIGAFAATRTVSSLLFGLTPTDPLTLVAATFLLISVATLAGYLPARRATQVDPMAALRSE
jgi:predicted permease